MLSLVALLTLSCSDQEDISSGNESYIRNKNNNISMIKISKTLEMKDENEKKLAYSLLNVQEKLFIWDNKIDVLIEDNLLYGVKIDLDQKQKEFLLNFKNNLKLEIFSKKVNDKKEYFKNVYVPDALEEAKVLFKNDYLFGMVFYDISVPLFYFKNKNLKENTLDDLIIAYMEYSSLKIDVGGNQSFCDCDSGAFFSCQWGQHDKYCKPLSCSGQTDCGFAWAWDCNGICKL